MKKTLFAGLAAVLFFLTSTGIAMAGDDAKNKTDSNKSKATGLYDNVRILQEQINSLTERIGRIETLHEVGDRFTDMGDGTVRDNDSWLIWLKDANCFGPKNWSDAMAAAASLKDRQCGLTDESKEGDWRLPTKTEWDAFYTNVYTGPALVNTRGDAKWSEGDAFNRVQSDSYWSETEGEMAGLAYEVEMGVGFTIEDYKDAADYVWPVRTHHRFTDMGDGTIRDNNSQRIWLKDANCFGLHSWDIAWGIAEFLAHGQCGLTDGSEEGDWRLPTTDEWQNFVSSKYENPALVNTVGDAKWSEGDAFRNVQSQQYWSDAEPVPYVAPIMNMGSGVAGEERVDNPQNPTYVWTIKK